MSRLLYECNLRGFLICPFRGYMYVPRRLTIPALSATATEIMASSYYFKGSLTSRPQLFKSWEKTGY